MPATLAQRAALDKGNQRRVDASRVKAELAAGDLAFRDALEDDRAGCVTVGALLRSLPGWGKPRAIRALKLVERDGRTRISDWRRVDELTARERDRLAAVVEGRA